MKEEKKENKSWLKSESFIKRALAIYGYAVVGGLIVGGIFWAVILMIAVFMAFITRII